MCFFLIELLKTTKVTLAKKKMAFFWGKSSLFLQCGRQRNNQKDIIAPGFI